jgi:hypothetical protein
MLTEGPWRILVAAANCGSANDKYLQGVVKECRLMSINIDVLILDSEPVGAFNQA